MATSHGLTAQHTLHKTASTPDCCRLLSQEMIVTLYRQWRGFD